MSNNIVVSLDSNETRLLAGFKKAEAAAKHHENVMNNLSKTGEKAGDLITEAMLRGAKGTEKATDFMLRELRKIKGDGAKLADAMDAYFQEIGYAGKHSADDVIEAWSKVDPKIAETLKAAKAQIDETTKSANFDKLKSSLAGLGGDFSVMKEQIDKALLMPTTEASHRAVEIIEQMQKLNPDAAEKIRDAIKSAKDSIEQSNFEKIADSLNHAGKEGEAIKKLLRDDASAAAIELAGGIDNIKNSIKAWKPHLAEAIDLLNSPSVTLESQIRAASDQLKAMGGDFSILAEELETALVKPTAEAKAKAEQMVAEIGKLDPSKAKAVRDAIVSAEQKAAKSSFAKLNDILSSAGGNARELASVFSEEMRQATFEAEGGIDGVVAKIIAMKPEMAATANTWREEMTTANAKAHETLSPITYGLEQIGPAGQNAARKLREEFVSAGRISQAAVDKIFLPLDGADARVKVAMERVQDHIKNANKDGEDLFRSMGTNAVNQLTALAGGYLGVQEAIQGVTNSIRQQMAIIEDARQGHITLAEAQAAAIENLSTMKPEDRKYLLGDFVKNTASEFKISDLSSLTIGIGNARSSGAVDVAEIQNIIRTSAEMNFLSQGNIDETASAITKTMTATGEKNTNILASQLLVGKEQSQVIETDKFFRNAPATMITGASLADEDKRARSAMESLAVFVALSKAGADDQGDSSQTATIQLNEKVAEFFSKIGEETQKVTKDLAELRAKNASDPMTPSQRLEYNDLKSRQQSKPNVERDLAIVRSQISNLQGKKDRSEFRTPEARHQASVTMRKLTEEESKLEKKVFDDKDQASLISIEKVLADKEKAFRKKEAEYIKTIEGNKINGRDISTLDPGTVGSRIEFIRGNNLRDKFDSTVDQFGEQRFRQGMKELLGGGKTSTIFTDTDSLLKRSANSDEIYRRTVSEVRGGMTAELQLASAATKSEASNALQDVSDTMGAMLSQVRETAASAMEKTRRGSGVVDGVGEFVSGEFGIRAGVARGSDALIESVGLIEILKGRSLVIQGDGKTPISKQDETKIDRVEAAVTTIFETLEGSNVREQFKPSDIENAIGEIQRRRRFYTREIAIGEEVPASFRGRLDAFDRLESLFTRQLESQSINGGESPITGKRFNNADMGFELPSQVNRSQLPNSSATSGNTTSVTDRDSQGRSDRLEKLLEKQIEIQSASLNVALQTAANTRQPPQRPSNPARQQIEANRLRAGR